MRRLVKYGAIAIEVEGHRDPATSGKFVDRVRLETTGGEALHRAFEVRDLDVARRARRARDAHAHPDSETAAFGEREAADRADRAPERPAAELLVVALRGHQIVGHR